MSAVVELAIDLVSRPSITPEDAGCQQRIAERLEPLGFTIEPMIFADTTNLWARRGTEAPLFCFAGHTDVVPPGDRQAWNTPPFEPTIIDGLLYGRGIADMKGGVAAMTIAAERFVQQHPDHKGSIAFLLTSDEEGPYINGTVKVMETLTARGEKIDYCLLGEPSCDHELGDAIKVGRRGSLSGKIQIHGTQGHVAYPEKVDNPIHRAAPFLAEFTQTQWDQGNEFFPPTSLQIVAVEASSGAGNVVPSTLEIRFNFRFGTASTVVSLKERVEALLQQQRLDYSLSWDLSGEPFLTGSGRLLDITLAAMEAETGIKPHCSTSGGTSDGRFIVPTGTELLEVGPLNATLHKVNEAVPVAHLEQLVAIYERVLAGVLL